MAKLQSTRQKAKLSFQNSELLTNEEYIFPRFDILKDITLGRTLGKGGFGTVIEIKDIHVNHDIVEQEEKDKEIGIVANNRAEKSNIFRIDDYEHEKQKRKRSHSFKLPRRFSSKDDSLKTSNSHDGCCEGLSTSTNSRLSKINERETQSERTSSMQQSKSHDCILDESHPTAGIVMKGSFSSSEENKSGRRKQRSKNRTRSLSWKAAKEDVSHFFHRPLSNHHRKQHHNDHGVHHAVDVVAEGIHHVEDVVTEGLHHAEDVITDVAERIQEKVSGEHHDDGKIGESLHEEEKKGQDDESSTLQRNESEHTSESCGISSTPITLERPPRNFSLLAWRDCAAGEESNDALSPEEWKKFNIDYSNISETSVGVSMRRLSDGSTADNKKEGDNHTGITSQLSASGARHELIVEPEVSNHHRKQHHNDHGVHHAVDVVAEGIHHVEDVVTEGLHHAEDVITDVAERIQEKVSGEHHDDGKIGESLHEEEKKGQDDESSTLQRNESEHTSESCGISSTPITLERPPRNFSLLAWRDCAAGEESNDALSPEEWKKFNIDYSNISETSVGVSMRRLSDESTADNKKEGDNHTGITSQLSALGARHELIVEPEVSKRQRRLVLFSAPTVESDDTSNGEEESERSSTSYHEGWYQDITHVNQHATDHIGDARYVIKIISSDIVENDFKKFLQAARDMSTETYFLSGLSHPNILKMRAVGQGDMFSPSFFLVLDRLYDTLTDRIEGTWKAQLDHLENDIIVWGRAHKLKVLWEERMSIMKDLAGALSYLHEMKIIYRDIKPENIGFDSHGIVKLFDFGLAKQVNEEDMCANGTYKLTPNTGSIRYMAPENSTFKPTHTRSESCYGKCRVLSVHLIVTHPRKYEIWCYGGVRDQSVRKNGQIE